MHTTKSGERIFIQYPGKESRRYTKNGKERKDTAIRPWDFRPELYRPDTNSWHKHLGFADIWASIFETAENLIQNNQEEILRMFATLLYRMAFLLDHTKIDIFKSQERDMSYNGDNEPEFSNEKQIELPSLLRYTPNEKVIEHITEIRPRWCDMSFEAFLFYNDLLGWNEDCKYYYRDRHTNKWQCSTGRVNTICTHIRILGYILKNVALSDIFYGFSTQNGISPASEDEVTRICKGYIKTG